MNGFIIQIRFTKLGRARFLSHHELMVLIERAVRRSKIPVKSSEGFNPRLRVSFPTALPLGISSNEEVIFIANSEWMPSGEILKRLKEQFVPGIEILSVEPLPDNCLPQVKYIEYRIVFDEELKMPSQEQINSIMAQEKILINRHKKDMVKTVDIRKFIVDMRYDESKNIILTVKYDSNGSVAPSEVLAVMNVDIRDQKIRIVKEKTIFDRVKCANKSVSS